LACHADGPDAALQLHPNIIALKTVDAVHLRPVFMSERIVTQQIAQGVDTQFFFEGFGPLGTNTF
jgi:hypothetical protein